MRTIGRLFSTALVVSVATAGVMAACGGGDNTEATPPSPASSSGGSGGSLPDASSSDAATSEDSGMGLLDVATGEDADTTVTIEPANPEIVVQTGQPVPTVTFVAKSGSKPVSAKWLVDRGEIGTIGLHDGTFLPRGDLGGVANVTAAVGSSQVTTTVKVVVKTVQNGHDSSDAGTGMGGWGGVGGEGLGVPVDDGLLNVLQSAAEPDPALGFLYPYNGTVWPLGLLAPLLQWSPGAAPAEGIVIQLSSAHYQYTGYFGRPAPLPDGAPFVRHPIPQDVWKAATQSSAGGDLIVSLTVASGGKAYGPITQTWHIANGPLKGTVYYQSYGTNLAKNYSGAIGGDGMFGGATLAIRGGSAEPSLVAGTNGGKEACRVCHTVSADGSRMIVQHGDNYAASSSYALTAGNAETPYGTQHIGKFGWVGLSPDGTMGLTNAAPLYAGQGATSGLFDMNTAEPLPATGLEPFAAVGFPAFSPDGTRVSFTFQNGTGTAETGPGDTSQLIAMDFDAATYAFSNPRLLYKGTADRSPGWPSFLPSNKGVVFSVQSKFNDRGEFMMTRYGGRGELWWADLATGTAHPLDRANGKIAGVSYLPVGPNGHDDDTTLQYEPTVNPVVSGGYAWVVFTSRRMYGNVATIDPWWSDPREHDLTANATPKKLWVAAVDLNAEPGTDPSHPAFYLPAQELMAGNTRGFWVVDPCKGDGEGCESGDQCCGGFCQPDADAGGMICSNHTTECSKEYEKCEVDADCCDALTGTTCINGRCAKPQPPR